MHSDITISQADHRPMYLQIMEQIRHRVAIGDWPAGQEVPSIRALAIALRVSVITVKRAYLELEHEGVIVTRQGRGSFIADNCELCSSLQTRELDAHLQAAITSARLLGVSDADLQQRLQALLKATATPASTAATLSETLPSNRDTTSNPDTTHQPRQDAHAHDHAGD